ncbi:MAG: hypothetical protein KA761_13445 [Gemmatimonadaceae bacterium]|jgi:hypothetical protein|nr:hypothetical protein [Gemmatimonadaceae bacterium]
MSQESVIYAINLIIGAILAALLTQHWRRDGREWNLGAWMVAAWVMTAADLLFALRPELPYWIGRTAPTLLVTVGQVVLLLWAMRTAGRATVAALGATIVTIHAIALVAFLLIDGIAGWRSVTNGLLWGTLSVAAFAFLRRAPGASRSALAIPAAIFLAHGLFHAFRLSFAAVVASGAYPSASEWVQVIGDVEVSFFMVALFVSLLVAHLHLRNEALRAALHDVQLLSELLPICAWCRKVRADDGYWQQLEHYFTARRQVQFTHGICDSCNAEHFGHAPGA